jgi:hypothetical protein
MAGRAAQSSHLDLIRSWALCFDVENQVEESKVVGRHIVENLDVFRTHKLLPK